MRILISCPPMLGMIDNFQDTFNEFHIELVTPEITQCLTAEELIVILPSCDAWIAGDDPANREVLTAGKNGRLKSVVKWGVGTDNVDIVACKDLGISFTNTPDVFGKEVADVAVSYCIALARQLFQIDRAVRSGNWLKIRGTSLDGKNAAIVGFGSIGIELASRVRALNMNVSIYDPSPKYPIPDDYTHLVWPNSIESVDFLFLVCPLTKSTYHLINKSILKVTKPSLQIINVSRGQLIDEVALMDALNKSLVGGIAMDVFETEPPDTSTSLLQMEHCIFGSHNSSNTNEAVKRASYAAIDAIMTSFSNKDNDR